MSRILLVDDNDFERQGIRKILDKQDLELEIVDTDNGQKALDYLNSQHFDILITDMKMPLMNGVELVQRVRGFNSEIKILIISGHDDFEYVKSVLSYNVAGYLLKPVNIVELIDAVVGLLGNKQEVSTDHPVIRDVLQIIHRDYGTNLTLEIVADMVHLSPSYLSSLFSKEVGQGFSKYLASFRLNQAERLLRKSNIRIANIASFIGINNSSYFDRLFKKEYGMNPIDYRKKFGEADETSK